MRKNFDGKLFGRFTVIRDAPQKSHIRLVWVQCSCGSPQKIVSLANLKNRHTKSCGCFNSEKTATRNFKHGKAHSRLYNVWSTMKARCYRKSCKSYEHYGARGIRICDQWIQSPDVFIDFCKSNGWVEGLQVDRIDNNGNYEPGNVRFITITENLRNLRTILKTNTSGYRGVYPHGNKFAAKVSVKGFPRMYKGKFLTPLGAAIFRDNFCREHGIPVQFNAFAPDEISEGLKAELSQDMVRK